MARRRLLAQQLESPRFKSAGEVVAFMGAMQAQDFAMARWAVGIRLPGATIEGIEGALQRGEIIRTHLLRPTWHFVSAGDVRWMLVLTAPHIKSSLRSRHTSLELDDAFIRKTNALLEKEARREGVLTRDHIARLFASRRIAMDDNRLAHMLLYAELDGVLCSGPPVGSKHTYALLEERVPESVGLKRDEALAELARRYFVSHGPATLQDFTWWSGLPAKDVRRAVDMAKPGLVPEEVDSRAYWADGSRSRAAKAGSGLHLLPAYDEYLLAYKDRAASLHSQHHRAAISTNGVFYPTVLLDGKVIGLWRRTIAKDQVVVSHKLFRPLDQPARRMMEKAIRRVGVFLGKEAKLEEADSDP
ncbi:MAG: hypothetical protein H6Q32_1302 [Bacteroidetes bacterium]|nr:hypothetical protein [Bacteroidota bacterium]